MTYIGQIATFTMYLKTFECMHVRFPFVVPELPLIDAVRQKPAVALLVVSVPKMLHSTKSFSNSNFIFVLIFIKCLIDSFIVEDHFIFDHFFQS